MISPGCALSFNLAKRLLVNGKLLIGGYFILFFFVLFIFCFIIIIIFIS